MSRFAAGGLTSAGSTTLPIISLYSAAAASPIRVREIGIFNTTSTAVALKLCRITTAGTKGAALTNAVLNGVDGVAALGTAFNTHTVAPTLTDMGFRGVLGAAVGSGIIWTFEDWELTISASATNAIGVVVENGTGQATQSYLKWQE